MSQVPVTSLAPAPRWAGWLCLAFCMASLLGLGAGKAQDLPTLARAITVKVLAGESWGSGTIIRRSGATYGVITNAHVLTAGVGRPILIRTADGCVYPARLTPHASNNSSDLALLEFTSTTSYSHVSLDPELTSSIGAPVYSAGYPLDPQPPSNAGFVLAKGRIVLILQRMFAGGYQVGYSNRVEKGMSGGPVLSAGGRLVAINGLHAFPIWGNPYVYDDGSIPPREQLERMRELSWGIPPRGILMFLGALPASSPAAIAPPSRPFFAPQPEPLSF